MKAVRPLANEMVGHFSVRLKVVNRGLLHLLVGQIQLCGCCLYAGEIQLLKFEKVLKTTRLSFRFVDYGIAYFLYLYKCNADKIKLDY